MFRLPEGNAIGPASPISFSESPGAVPPTALGGVTVTFDSVAAQLTYASSTEVDAVVPFAVAGRWISSFQLSYAGAVTPPVSVPITASNPQIYGTRVSGGSLVADAWIISNGAQTPVTHGVQLNWGDTVAFRVTGAGQATTPIVDGSGLSEQPFTPSLPFTLSLGRPNGANQSLPIVSMTYAPGGLTGVVEVLTQLPSAMPQGVGDQFYVRNARFTSAFGDTWPFRRLVLPLRKAP